MLKVFKWIALPSIGLLVVIVYACNNKLNIQPQGSLLQPNVTNNSGVQGLLIGAYALLSGEDDPGQNLGNGSAASNYVYGSECADEFLQGIYSFRPARCHTTDDLVRGAIGYQ